MRTKTVILAMGVTAASMALSAGTALAATAPPTSSASAQASGTVASTIGFGTLPAPISFGQFTAGQWNSGSTSWTVVGNDTYETTLSDQTVDGASPVGMVTSDSPWASFGSGTQAIPASDVWFTTTEGSSDLWTDANGFTDGVKSSDSTTAPVDSSVTTASENNPAAVGYEAASGSTAASWVIDGNSTGQDPAPATLTNSTASWTLDMAVNPPASQAPGDYTASLVISVVGN